MVADAALGAAFELLFKSVYEATHTCVRFSSDLNRLNSILTFIKPVIHEIAALDKILDTPHHETEAFTARLLKGEKLVRKCLEVPRWNVVLRMYYSMKISMLEDSLVGFFQVNAAALHFRESKRMAVSLQSLEQKVNDIVTVLHMMNAGRNSRKVVELAEEDSPIHVVSLLS